MPQQIRFFRKNFSDLDYIGTTITVTDSVATDNGQSIISYVRNRKNTDGWATTGSNDSAGTSIEVEFNQPREITNVFLVGHNFKSFTIQYWNGSAYTDFSPAISETNITSDFYNAEVTSQSTNKLKVVINSTQIANQDKFLNQLITTESRGQLEGWPIIRNPKLSTNKVITNMLSGKVSVVDSVGFFSTELNIKLSSSDNDMSIIEDIYGSFNGTLVWLCGGDIDQFKTDRQGYRLKDFYLMKPTDEYSPEWYEGLYKSGTVVNLKLSESVR